MSFWSDPSPWYHYVVMIPVYCLFVFFIDTLLRGKPGIFIWIVIISLFLMPLHAFVYEAFASISYMERFFVAGQGYCVIMPLILITSYRIFGPMPKQPYEDNPNMTRDDYLRMQNTRHNTKRKRKMKTQYNTIDSNDTNTTQKNSDHLFPNDNIQEEMIDMVTGKKKKKGKHKHGKSKKSKNSSDHSGLSRLSHLSGLSALSALSAKTESTASTTATAATVPGKEFSQNYSYDGIDLPHSESIEIEFHNTTLQTGKKRGKWRKSWPDWLGDWLVELYDKPAALNIQSHCYYVFFVVSMVSCLVFETLLDDDSGNLDELVEDSPFKVLVKIHQYLGDGRYFNVAAGVISILTMPIPKYPNRYKTRFWYLDRYADFIMYLPDGKTDKKLGFWWILLNSLWHLEFVLRVTGFENIIFVSIYLLVPIIQASYRFHFGIWAQSRLHAIWGYYMVVSVLRNNIFNTSDLEIDWGNNEPVVLGILSFVNFIFSLVYAWFWFHGYLRKLRIAVLRKSLRRGIDASIDINNDLNLSEKGIVIGSNNISDITLNKVTDIKHQGVFGTIQYAQPEAGGGLSMRMGSVLIHHSAANSVDFDRDYGGVNEYESDEKLNGDIDDGGSPLFLDMNGVVSGDRIKFVDYHKEEVYLHIKNSHYKIGDKLPMDVHEDDNLDTVPNIPMELKMTKGKKIYQCGMGLVTFILLLVQLVLILGLMIIGWLVTIFCCCCYGSTKNNRKRYRKRKYHHEQKGLENLCYTWCFCKRNRRFWGTIRLNLLTTSITKRGIFWHIANYFTGLYQMLEMIICKGFVYGTLWECYADEFGDWFPMFFGLGCGEYNEGYKMTQTKDSMDGYHGLGYLSNSKSHYKLLHSPLMTLHCPDRSPTHLAIRQACFKWFYTIGRNPEIDENCIFNQIVSEYAREYVWDKDKKSGLLVLNRTKMQRVLNDLFFRYTLGTRLTDTELEYLDVLTTGGAALGFLSGSLPKTLSFTLMGHKFSRKFLEIVYVLGFIFYRNKNTQTMKNVFAEARKANIDDWSMIKAMSQFYIPNAMGVVHVAMDTIKFLQSNPDEYIPLYNSDPQGFIKEVLRLRTPLPFINSFLWTKPKQIEIKGKKYNFPALTPFQIQLTMANQDSNVFGGMTGSNDYAHEFDPTRETLDKTMTFRGVFSELGDKNIDKRPTRYCPAYQMVMYKFVPFLVSTFAKFDKDRNNTFTTIADGRKEFTHEFDNREYDYNDGTDYFYKVKSIHELMQKGK